VVVEKSSWAGGDMCTIRVYTFRAGAIVPMLGQDKANCPADEVPWKVAGTMDAIEILLDWDEARGPDIKLYRDECTYGAPCSMGQRRWNPADGAYQ
jgi:hypothetical protein